MLLLSQRKRKEIKVPNEAFLILSVGELNKNKNHQVVVRALGEMTDNNIHYAIAGKGDQKRSLERLSKDLNVNLHLLGYRTDVAELYKTADCYCLPSIREGLNVSLMEAVASGLPCMVSKIRGNEDIVNDENGCFFHLANVVDVKRCLIQLNSEMVSCTNRANCFFDINKVCKDMYIIYKNRDINF